VSAHLAQGGRLNSITRHILGLYHGQPRARQFRRHLSEHGVGEGPGLDVLVGAIAIAEGRAPTIDAGTSSRAVAAE
jgi:tRNA-dihydrouridine synthase A